MLSLGTIVSTALDRTRIVTTVPMQKRRILTNFDNNRFSVIDAKRRVEPTVPTESIDLSMVYFKIVTRNQSVSNRNSIRKRFTNDWRRNQVGSVGRVSVNEPDIDSQ